MYMVIINDILDPETTSRTLNIQIFYLDLGNLGKSPQFRRLGQRFREGYSLNNFKCNFTVGEDSYLIYHIKSCTIKDTLQTVAFSLMEIILDLSILSLEMSRKF